MPRMGRPQAQFIDRPYVVKLMLTKNAHFGKQHTYRHPQSSAKETLNNLIPFMVRQAHHERNQQLSVRPELVEGLVQRFPKRLFLLK